MTDWAQANQRVLAPRSRSCAAPSRSAGADAAVAELEAARAALPAPAALDEVAAAFGLSPFERDVLLLCAGVELSTDSAPPFAAHGGPDAPTFGFALATLPDPHWTALLPAAPAAPLAARRAAPGDTLAARRLRIDERILHQLTGVSYLDPDLQPLLEPARSRRRAAAVAGRRRPTRLAALLQPVAGRRTPARRPARAATVGGGPRRGDGRLRRRPACASTRCAPRTSRPAPPTASRGPPVEREGCSARACR